MGRKIRGAKHHGVKDPLKQQAQREKSLKSKINAPPSHPDDQPIPKSLTRLFDYKERQEQRLKAKKNKTKIPEKPLNDEEQHANPMRSLARLPGESGRGFTLRINSALHSITRRHLQAREMERSLHPDDYLPEEDAKEERYDFIQQKKLKRKLKFEKKKRAEGEEGGEGTPAKLSRMQRWALKKKEKKANITEQEAEAGSEPRYERVRFGEVAHEPPSLHVKPRRARADGTAPRPGQRDLLLNKLLNINKEESAVTAQTAPRITVNLKSEVDRKAKRRSLPAGVRMRLEQSQKEAIDAYRALKTKYAKSKV